MYMYVSPGAQYMRRTLTNSSYKFDQNVMKTGVDTLQTCDMKSY